jgi:hypothetical protein
MSPAHGILPKRPPFELLYPNCMMNSVIRFLPLQENHKFGNNIILNYKNYSQNQIAFPFSVGVKIFTYNQNDLKWVEVKNNMQYSVSPGPYHFVGPTNEESSYDGIVISSDTSDDQTLEMRVTITGYVYRDSIVTDECVGAFMDIRHN